MKLKLARTIVVEKYIWRSMIFEEKWHYSVIYVKSRFHCLINRINFGRIVHRRIYWLIPCLHKHYHRRGMKRRSTLDNHLVVDNILRVRSIFYMNEPKIWMGVVTSLHRCKLRHRPSVRRPRFPIRVQNFGDLVTFSVDYCILYSECPKHFYFRFVWPTDLQSIPHASTI